MNLDIQAMLSDAQSLAINAGANALSTNVYDFGAVGTIPLGGSPIKDPGRGELEVWAQIVTAAVGANSTLKVQLIMADSSDMLTNPEVLYQSDDIAVAKLVQGYQFRVGDLPAGVTKRYFALKYVNASASNMTAGAITAGFIGTRQSNGFIG